MIKPVMFSSFIAWLFSASCGSVAESRAGLFGMAPDPGAIRTVHTKWQENGLGRAALRRAR